MAIPIPHRVSGFLLGDPAAVVTIDAFIDIQCPHSLAIWPTLLEVSKHYQNQSVSLRCHLITLSNHRQAWDMSLGLFALAQNDANKFYDFASFVYDRQTQFYNGVFLNKTHNDLIQLVADFAQEHANVDREAFIKRMQDNDIYIKARTPIRYAATKAVWATPTLFINNADDVAVDHKSDLAQWQSLIDPLLQGYY
ncbi:thioredoxin domain-containing protein [uncultured Psychrosphaera sp.]|uniref:DsbA family protein n=1 Tax=uncultured Psychrosphaera sp. TaxID=1403522 RepID=UPI00261151D8|nr:thioredoxin domain-containing protein [uncultured Psychrosphaera sp.]